MRVLKLACAMAFLISTLQVPLHASPAEGLTHKRVLALYWYGKDLPANAEFDRGLQVVFKSWRIEYHAEYFEPNFFPGDVQEDWLRDYLQQKYSDHRVDAVIAMSWPASDFLLKHRDELFPDVPIVFNTAYRMQLTERAAGMNAAGVVFDNNHARTLEAALRFHPDTEQVFVIDGTPERDNAAEAYLRERFQGFENRVPITYLTDLPLDVLLARVKNLPERSLIYYSGQEYEEPGLSLSVTDVLSLITSEAKVPIYTFGAYVGHGAVGGYIVDGFQCGVQAGRLALRIMDGYKPDELPVVEVQSIPVFDWRQLRRWGISESQLPPGSAIRFRELTVFEQYKWRIIGAFVLCVLQFVFIAGLLAERRRRRHAQSTLLERLDFERLLSDLSADFTSLPASEVDHSIKKWIHKLVLFLGADSGDLAKVAGNGGPNHVLQEFSLAIPIHIDESTWMLTFCAPKSRRVWPEDLVPRIRLAGEILSGALVRKANGEALRESQQRYKLATNSGRVVVWDWDLKTSEFYADPLLKSILGYEEHEVGNYFDDWVRLVHPDDVDFLMERFRGHIQCGTAQFEAEHRFLQKDGGVRWFLTSGMVVQTDQGSAVRMVGTGTDITQRKLAEEELQRLSTRLLDAQDQERRRIARELHDGTAQNLCAVLFNLEMLESTMSLQVNLQHMISDCRTFCNRALDEIRTLSYVLHPPMLDYVGLLGSLRWYLDGFTKRTGIDVKLAATQDIGRLPEKVETDLFRIVQECLSNIHRHSGSLTAQVSLELEGAQVVLQVEDQGHGMPVPAGNGSNSRPAGVGLSGMDQRLRHLGGHLEIESNSHGTTIIAVVPLPREVHDSEKPYAACS
jgi:PAS domain S-box-containing protein